MNSDPSLEESISGISKGPWTIDVANPSPYERSDYVEVDLESLGVDPELDESSLRLLRLNNGGSSTEVPFQIDRVLGENFPRRIMTFLSTKTPSGPEDYSYASASFRLEKGSSSNIEAAHSQQLLYVEHFHQKPVDEDGKREWDKKKDVYGVKLHNDRLAIYFSLVSHPRLHTGTDYSGAATSVWFKDADLVGAGEMLCPFGEWPPKRWGQITELVFFPLPWELKWFTRIPFVGEHGLRYDLISSSSGLMRATVTLRSEKMNIEYACPSFMDSGTVEISCYLYRVLSFYPERPYYVEDLFVLDEEGHSLSFRPYYLSEVQFPPSVPRYLARFEHTPDYFALWSYFAELNRGYGFASDAHIRGIELEGNQFRWRLPHSHHNRCVHYFMFHGWGDKFDPYHEIGHCGWYERVYKPMEAMPLKVFSIAKRYSIT